MADGDGMVTSHYDDDDGRWVDDDEIFVDDNDKNACVNSCFL